MSIPNELHPVETRSTPSISPKPFDVDRYETFKHNKNFASLNGVRCFCCLAVIKVHLEWQMPGPRLFGLGWLGVDLFFAISGFLIVTLLIRERERNGTISLKKFYIRRALRIFPIYYLLIFALFAFSVAVYPWKPKSLQLYAWTFPVLLTYTQDVIRVPLGMFFHCWSLAMEEQFYQFWPTVEKYAIQPVRWAVLVGLLIVSQAVNFGLLDGPIEWIYGDSKAKFLPIFLITFTPILLGVTLAYLLNNRRTFGMVYRVVGYRWSPFLFLGLVFAACEISPEMTQGWSKLGVHLIFMLLLGSLVIREDHFARPILTFKPIERLGAISYGIYLYHVFVISLFDFSLPRLHLGQISKPLTFVIVTIGTVAVAEASYRLIEQPLLKLKDRYHS